jgi:hypothetical protein
MIELKLNIDPFQIDKHLIRQTAKYLLALCGDDLVTEDPKISSPAVAVKEVPVVAPEPTDKYLLDLCGGDLVAEDHKISYIAIEVPVVYQKPIPEHTHTASPLCELDSKGEPWDAKIHSRTKSKNADGTWKLMRGISAPSIPVAPVIPVAVVTAPIEPPVAEENQFFKIMAKITQLVKDGIMTHAEIVHVVRPFGIESIPLIAQKPELIPSILMALESAADLKKGN